jgi:trehalose 6-phosphate synthase/phosphatase
MRTVIVSNRLPVTVRTGPEGLTLQRSMGGLATGLTEPHERSKGMWVGWPGLPDEELKGHEVELSAMLAEHRLVPVGLNRTQVAAFYESYCNSLVWPLFHSFINTLPLEGLSFETYEEVNQAFAEAAARAWHPGDVVWVHDYQLMRVPALLRRLIPEARIGFFLHIPFPPSEIFRILPSREAIMEGLLGADLIGFHTASYTRAFASSLLRVLGVATDMDRVRWQGREVRLGTFPMGVDAEGYQQLGQDPEVLAEAQELRGSGDVKLLVGIDRLDYTKGIPRRMLAFERLLKDNPQLHGKVKLIQVAVPSRTEVNAYADFRANVDGLVGRINGAFGTPSWTPLSYLYRGLEAKHVVALYRAADVLLVTPIRDGMNLVAKEFIASRVDEEGVLVLSEFAGAASELAEAVQVNPYDVPRTAEAIKRALDMLPEERKLRMQGMRRRVLRYHVRRWVEDFLQALDTQSSQARLTYTPRWEIDALAARIRGAPARALLLDYDGTLVNFASTPELARPDPELIQLLSALAALPATQVHIVSGRGRENLEHWLGKLPLSLHGEHGLWSRHAEGSWAQLPVPPGDWREPVLKILQDFSARTPGTLVEEKTVALAWHYRMADPEFGLFQANELKLHLNQMLSNAPIEVLTGEKVVEVRPHGVHKGKVVTPISHTSGPGSLLVALGDDRTDEDMFAAMPEEGVSIHVGEQPSKARYRLADVRSVRQFLRSLL